MEANKYVPSEEFLASIGFLFNYNKWIYGTSKFQVIFFDRVFRFYRLDFIGLPLNITSDSDLTTFIKIISNQKG